MAALRVVRACAAACVGTAGRTARSLPVPVRTRLGKTAAWFARHRRAPLIQDWSSPLIGTQPDGMPTSTLRGVELANAGLGQLKTPMGPGHAPGINSAGSRPLRCLLTTSRLDAGGLDEVVAFLARRLPRQMMHTAVLHATPDAPANEESADRLGRMLRSAGIEVHAALEDEGPLWIERWRPDVISAHGAPYWVFAAARQAGVPYVDNLHGLYRLFGQDWRWHAQAVRDHSLSAVVAVSELVRQQYLADNSDFPPDRIVVIPNGVDDERRRGGDRAGARDRLGLTNEYLYVSLARHCLQKNSYGLVAAFAELARRRPEAHLVIAGRCDDSAYYRKMLRLRNSVACRDRIHLRDHAAAPAELLAAADGFALDSFFEGWSLASMEALFTGLPVVLSDVGGAREQVGHDPARGYVVANPLGDPLRVDWELVRENRYRDQDNRDELASAMERLIADRKDYLANRERLAAESATRFSPDSCVARHAAVLRAVAAGKPPASAVAAPSWPRPARETSGKP